MCAFFDVFDIVFFVMDNLYFIIIVFTFVECCIHLLSQRPAFYSLTVSEYMEVVISDNLAIISSGKKPKYIYPC